MRIFALTIYFSLLILIFCIFSKHACVAKEIKVADTAPTWTTLEQNMIDTKKEAGYASGIVGDKPRIEVIISNIIKVILSFTGAIFLILLLWGGNEWMTAGGNEEKLGNAKKLIINSAIGLVIILAAYLLTHLVVTVLVGATGV